MSFDTHGRLTWEAWIKVPYVGLLHDFAVTQNHVAFLAIPMATNVERMKQGQVHFAWDSRLPTWLGVLRRGGDGSDLRWFKGPERCATHTMGTLLRWHAPLRRHGHGRDQPVSVLPESRRRSLRSGPRAGSRDAPLGRPRQSRPDYDMEILYPENGILSRQDDRYQTVPYGVGFMPTLDASRPLDPRLAAQPDAPLQLLDAIRSRDPPRDDSTSPAPIRACRNAASCRGMRGRPKVTDISSVS